MIELNTAILCVVFMKKEKNKIKPKYNMLQNSAYMISTAWKIKEKKVVILSLLFAFFSVAASTLSLFISPTVLGQIEGKTDIVTLIITIGAFCLALAVCYAATTYIDVNQLWGRVQVRSKIISDISIKCAQTSYPNLENEKFKKLYAKSEEATCANSQPAEAIWTTLTEVCKNVLGFIVYLVLLCTVEWWIALIVIATGAVSYVISNRLNQYGYRHREELADSEQKMRYVTNVAGGFRSAKDIRLFNVMPWLAEMAKKAEIAFIAFHKKANGVYLWGSIADIAMTFLRNGIAYAYLIYCVFKGRLSAAEFLLYFSAVGGFATWVTGILSNLTLLNKQSLEICNIREFLEFPEQFRFEDGETLDAKSLQGTEIRLEDVSFAYPSSDRKILEHINLTLHPGEKLAVVGLNGAGKSTLIKLICGFYDPTEGRVLLNGEDIRKYNRYDYYNAFSAVFQNFIVLAGSIAFNVAQTDENIDIEKVMDSIRKAGLEEKVNSLPEKLNTNLNRAVYDDAVDLSGGETQRLMLARALYKDSPIVILDEPTAALDPIAEADIYSKYNEMTAGKSSVYVSHRLASTRFCDRIIFVENGGIAEEGTHDELLAKGGKYAELFNVQSKYYKEEDVSDEE